MPAACESGRQGAGGKGGLLPAAALLGGCTMLSRLLGLARDAVMAWLLGAGPVADALTAAMRLPHMARRMLAEGSLSMSLTAQLARRGNRREAAALRRALARRLGGVLLAGACLLGFCADPLLRLLSPGLDLSGGGTDAGLPGQLFRLCLPYIPAAGLAGLCMAVLHARRHFLIPALSPLLFNICVLAAAGVAVCWCSGQADTARALALGMSGGGLAQWLLQRLAVERLPGDGAGAARLAASPARRAAISRRAWRLLAGLPGGILGAAAPQLAMLAAMCPASLAGPGHMASLYYAERLLELPLGLVGSCLGMASLPRLSECAREGQWEEFARLRGLALRWAVRLSLPAAVGLAVVSRPLVTCLLGHGAFDANAIHWTAWAVLAYAPCLPACAVSRCLLAACHARGERRRAVWAGLFVPLFTLGAGLLFLSAGELGGVGAAAAASLALCLQTLLLAPGRVTVPGAHTSQWRNAVRFCCGQLAAAALVGLAAWAALCLTEGLATGLRLALAVAAGALAWPCGLWLVRDEAWRSLRQGFRRRQS